MYNTKILMYASSQTTVLGLWKVDGLGPSWDWCNGCSWKIFENGGIRDLYRGFGMYMVTYYPKSVVCWKTYSSAQHVIWKCGHERALI